MRSERVASAIGEELLVAANKGILDAHGDTDAF